MNNITQYALVIFLILVYTLTIWSIGAIQSNDIEAILTPKKVLIDNVQDLMAERNGYKQLYETANNGICTSEAVVAAPVVRK